MRPSTKVATATLIVLLLALAAAALYRHTRAQLEPVSLAQHELGPGASVSLTDYRAGDGSALRLAGLTCPSPEATAAVLDKLLADRPFYLFRDTTVNEVIRCTTNNTAADQVSGCSRGQLGTTAGSHPDNSLWGVINEQNVIINSVFKGGDFGFKTGEYAAGNASLTVKVPGLVMKSVIVTDETAANYPSGNNNAYPAAWSNVGFINAGAADFRLAPSSAYKRTATDGGNPGADPEQINWATKWTETGVGWPRPTGMICMAAAGCLNRP
jgi:hypothetical protein